MAQKSLNILTQLLINEATSSQGCTTVSGRPLILISLLNPRRNTILGSAVPASCYIRQRYYKKKINKSRIMFLVMSSLTTSQHGRHADARESLQFTAIWKTVKATLTLILMLLTTHAVKAAMLLAQSLISQLVFFPLNFDRFLAFWWILSFNEIFIFYNLMSMPRLSYTCRLFLFRFRSH